MEMTTATTIDTDGDGDNGNSHNGNDDKVISRYNNQLNGGPSAVERW